MEETISLALKNSELEQEESGMSGIKEGYFTYFMWASIVIGVFASLAYLYKKKTENDEAKKVSLIDADEEYVMV